MKSDQTTLASGYRAVMGFNLHQLLPHLTTKTDRKAQALAPNLPLTKRAWLFFPQRPGRHADFYFATATS
jgi:hypothetical protein